MKILFHQKLLRGANAMDVYSLGRLPHTVDAMITNRDSVARYCSRQMVFSGGGLFKQVLLYRPIQWNLSEKIASWKDRLSWKVTFLGV